MSIYLNDMPIEALGLSLVGGGPLLGGGTRSRETTPWRGRRGVVPAALASVEPWVYPFRFQTQETTAALRAYRHDLVSDYLAGVIEVRDDAMPDRVARGEARVFKPDVASSPTFVTLESNIDVEVVCYDASRWDAQPLSRVITATPTPIPCGSLPHGGVLLLTGTAAGALSGEVRIRYRGISGVLLGELVLTVALASGEWLEVNLDTQSLIKFSTTGVAEDVYDGWKSSTGAFFTLAPRDGNRLADAWGTLEVTAGVGLYLWRRRYET